LENKTISGKHLDAHGEASAHEIVLLPVAAWVLAEGIEILP
jgi:hypothetical protein